MENKPTSEEYEAKMKRAEELVDRAADWLGTFAGQVGYQIQKFTARAREEAEDIWAEAQHLRNQRRSGS